MYTVTYTKNHSTDLTTRDNLSQTTAWNLFNQFRADANVSFITYRKGSEVLYYLQCDHCHNELITTSSDEASQKFWTSDYGQVLCMDCCYDLSETPHRCVIQETPDGMGCVTCLYH